MSTAGKNVRFKHKLTRLFGRLPCGSLGRFLLSQVLSFAVLLTSSSPFGSHNQFQCKSASVCSEDTSIILSFVSRNEILEAANCVLDFIYCLLGVTF